MEGNIAIEVSTKRLKTLLFCCYLEIKLLSATWVRNGYKELTHQTIFVDVKEYWQMFHLYRKCLLWSHVGNITLGSSSKLNITGLHSITQPHEEERTRSTTIWRVQIIDQALSLLATAGCHFCSIASDFLNGDQLTELHMCSRESLIPDVTHSIKVAKMVIYPIWVWFEEEKPASGCKQLQEK